MKIKSLKKYAGLGLAALTLASASTALANADLTIATYNSDTQGAGINWGSMTESWDAAEGNPAGSLLCTGVFTSADSTPFMPYQCIGGGNPWWNNGTADFSQYKSVDFDIKYDPTSDITVAQFNDLSTATTTMTNKDGSFIMLGWAGSGYLAGSTAGFDVQVCGPGPVQAGTTLTNMPLPAAANGAWAHVSIPIDPTKSGLAGMSGITIHKWINQNWGIQNPANARIWIDNIVLKGTDGPPPPPTVKLPVKATPGLNVFASTAGLYDRQSAVLRQTAGLSWVGMATLANPVTYSFTIAGYPNSVNCEAYMFMIPNPNYMDGAPDWNETNCALVYIQGSSSSATAHFRYKVGEPGNQIMYGGDAPYTNAPGSWDGVTSNYLESGNLASVTNNGILGTWTLKFTSDTNVALIAPNGNSTNVIFPAYNVGAFAETVSPGFYIYLGMQANNADALNQAVVYSNFAVSNTASPFSEDFLTDTVLDTTNVWNTGPASDPKGVLIVPAGSASWVSWTLPNAGFGLQGAPTLGNPLAWTAPATGPILGMNGVTSQLLASNEIPAGNTAFFELIKRQFTQLQVLFDGETNAPNTLTGKGGTPTPVNAYDPVNVTINAVDSTFHLVSASDSVTLSSDDLGASIITVTAPLVGGTRTTQIYFDTAGTYTVSATNNASTNMLQAISAPITVN